MKFDFRSESFKRKFSSNIFACNFIIGFPKSNREDFSLKGFLNKEIKKAGLIFNPRLVLIGLRTTGPWSFVLEKLFACQNR